MLLFTIIILIISILSCYIAYCNGYSNGFVEGHEWGRKSVEWLEQTEK